jgi:hypothetical protein
LSCNRRESDSAALVSIRCCVSGKASHNESAASVTSLPVMTSQTVLQSRTQYR